MDVTKNLISVSKALAYIVFIGLIWEGIVIFFQVDPYYLPKLSAVLLSIWSTPDAYIAGFFHTLGEALIGYVAGALVGVAFGVIFYLWRTLREVVFPLFIISQTIPIIAFGAVIVLWFGNSLMSKAIIAFYLTFFPVAVNTLNGLRNIDPKQEGLLRSFGATRWKLLWQLQLPSALPQIFVALRLACTISLLGAIAGEWFGDTTGLGVLLLQAMYNEQMVELWAAVLITGVLGSLFFLIVSLVEHRVVFWRNEQV